MDWLRRTLEHPLVNLLVALVLIATSLAEGWETLHRDLVALDAGVHHGVLVFGFVNLLRTIPEVYAAAERVDKVGDAAEDR